MRDFPDLPCRQSNARMHGARQSLVTARKGDTEPKTLHIRGTHAWQPSSEELVDKMSELTTIPTFSRKRFLKVGATTAGAAVLASCGQLGIANVADAADKSALTATTSPALAEPVTLSFASVVSSPAPNYTGRMSVIKKYEQLHPNVTVKYQYIPYAQFFVQMLTRTLAGDAPTVAQNGYLTPQLAANNDIIATDDYLRVAGFKASDFWPAVWELGQFRGKNYSVPFTLDTRFTYYNPNLYKKMGVGPAKTWDDELAMAKAALPLGIHAYTMSWQADINAVWESVTNLLKTTGGDLLKVNPDGTATATLNTEPVYETLDFLRQMFVAQAFTPGALTHDQTIGKAEFTTDKTASWLVGNWEIADLETLYAQKKIDFNFGLAHNAIKKQRGASSGGWAWDIYKTAVNPDIAWDFVNFFLKPENINLGWADSLPPTVAGMNQPYYAHDPRNKFVLEVLSYSTWVIPPIAGFMELMPTMWRYMSRVLSGQSSSKQAMADGNRAVQALIDRGNNKIVRSKH